jgi:hypothetical protein
VGVQVDLHFLYLKLRPTFLALAQLDVAVEFGKHRLDLFAQVHRFEGRIMQLVAALAVIPAQMMKDEKDPVLSDSSFILPLAYLVAV